MSPGVFEHGDGAYGAFSTARSTQMIKIKPP